MAAESSPHTTAHRFSVALTTDGERATLVFSGALEAGMVRELEEQLANPMLRQARVWQWEMSGLARLDLTCAYALLRAATTPPEPAAFHIRGARRAVRRTLHHADVDAVATIEE